MPLLTASKLTLLYADLEVFSDITVEVPDRARIGLVGPNGGGKTSLVRVLVGELAPNSGAVHRSASMRIGYVAQTPSRAPVGTLEDEVMTAFAALRALEDELADSALGIQQAGEAGRRRAERRYSSLLQRYEALGGYDYRNLMERVTTGVGLTPETLATPAQAASGGERTRAALATALLTNPDLLVLDEPTNYLDFDGLAWLEAFLESFNHAYLVVSHDRYFLDKVVDRVWELDRGRVRTFRGNFTRFQALRAEQARRQQREFQRQQEYIQREEAFISRYRAGQRAREARGRATRLARLERIEAPSRQQEVALNAASAERTGRVVISTKGLRVGFADGGSEVQLLSVPDLVLERQSRTAIVGKNGAGKSTLVQTLLGHSPALSGVVARGHNVRVGYQRQGQYDLPEGASVLDALLQVRNMDLADARSYLAAFLFTGDDVFAPVGSLSGGERTRLALARLLATRPNLLVLDEPTTHLDIPSREALERVLLSFDGAILFVSHDRKLISMLARQMWVIEEGAVKLFPGAFEEWVDSRQEAAGPPPRTRRRSAKQPARPVPSPPEAEAAPDLEETIASLEARLVEIEEELERAARRQDVPEIARLGEGHQRTQVLLDEVLSEWGR